MNHAYINASESARQQAVAELQQLIQAHYPSAAFEVGPGADDPEGTYLTAIVDVDDQDEVMDLVIEFARPSASQSYGSNAQAGSTSPHRSPHSSRHHNALSKDHDP